MVKTGQSADRDGGTITAYDRETTLSQIRSFKGSGGKIRIGRYRHSRTAKKAFRSQFGLVMKICYNDENDINIYYISKEQQRIQITNWPT